MWLFTVAADTLTGMLVILPDGSTAREVKAHHASERDMPEAPPLSDYDE